MKPREDEVETTNVADEPTGTDDLWDPACVNHDGGEEYGTAAVDAGELPLDDDRREGASPVFSRFGSDHDRRLVADAIEEYLPQLRGLEKKNTEKGYMRNAAVVRGDADRLHDVLLPLLKEKQLELAAEPGGVEVRSGIANHLHSLIRRYVRDSVGPEDNPHQDFENEVCQRVYRWGRAIAEIAYAAGYRDRGEHPDAFLLRVLERLDHAELKEG